MNKRRARNNLDNKKRKEKLTEAKRDLTCSDTILEHDTHGWSELCSMPRRKKLQQQKIKWTKKQSIKPVE